MKSLVDEFWDKQEHAGIGLYIHVVKLYGGFIIRDEGGIMDIVFDDGQIGSYLIDILNDSSYLPRTLREDAKRDPEGQEIVQKLITKYKDLFYQYKFPFMEPLPLSVAV